MSNDDIQWLAEIAKLSARPKPQNETKPLTATLAECIKAQTK